MHTNHISVNILYLSHVFDRIQCYLLSGSFVFQTFAKVNETLGLFLQSARPVQALFQVIFASYLVEGNQTSEFAVYNFISKLICLFSRNI